MAKPANKAKGNGNGEIPDSSRKPDSFQRAMSRTLGETPQLASGNVQGRISTPEEAMVWAKAAGFGDEEKLLRTAIRDVKDPSGKPKLSEMLQFYHANELMERKSRAQDGKPDDERDKDVPGNMTINLFGMAGRVETAEQFFDQRVEQGVAGVFSYVAMIEVFGDYGCIDEARAVFDAAVQKEKAEEITYAAIMVAYGKAKNAEKAKEIFDMLGETAGVWTRLIMTAIYRECGRVEEAERLLGETVEKGLVDDDNRAVMQKYINYK